MTTHRVRASSPTPPRVYVEGPRASTGGILMTQAYDTRFDSRPRSSFSTIASSREGTSSRNNSVYETQPVSKKTYIDTAHPGGTISRTEYAVRPRRDSASADSRRPLSVITKNVSPTRPKSQVIPAGAVVMYETPRELKDDSTRYLQPSQQRQSTHHQRHDSSSRAGLSQYSAASGSSRADKEYHRRGPYLEKVSNSGPMPPVRYSEDDAPGSYSYTTPRQQFERDMNSTTPRPARRESVSRRERPSSTITERHEHLPYRHNTGPPSAATRQLERIERDDRRTSGFETDPDRTRDARRTRNSEKAPVVHQRDDGYSSARDDYSSRRSLKPQPYEADLATVGRNRYHDATRDRERTQRQEYEREREREPARPDRERERDRPVERRSERRPDREYERERERPRPKEYERIEQESDSRRRPRSRETSPDHSGLKTLATAAVGGLAAVGIVSHNEKKDQAGSDSDSRRERRRRRRKSHDPREEEKPDKEGYEDRRRRRTRRVDPQRQDESSGSDTPEDETSYRRPHSRTRRRDTTTGYGSDRDQPQLALPAPDAARRASRVPDESLPVEATRERPSQGPPDRKQQGSPINSQGRPLSPGEGEDARPRRVTLVEPDNKKEESKPRGILKPPRQDPFPEDPNPQREGVAPLKQAGADGIPAGARWTKISRMLVNPEALERAQERFEEREDYVIVLRVVSPENIDKLSEKTREIRAQREREWKNQIDERRRSRAERGDPGTDEDEHDDGGPQQPLAIEQAPSVPPVDLRQLTGQSSNAIPPVMPGAYAPQQWNNGPSARNLEDNAPVPVPMPYGQGIDPGMGGQKMPQAQHMNQMGMPPQQQHLPQEEAIASTYSQNV